MTVTRFINTIIVSGTTILSSGLNSLGIGSGVIVSGIDNSTVRDMSLKAEVTLGSVDLSSQSSPGVRLRLLETIDDGATYEDDDDQAWGVSLPVAATNAAHKRMGDLFIPPSKYALALVNETGVAFAATGNTLIIKSYTPVTDV